MDTIGKLKEELKKELKEEIISEVREKYQIQPDLYTENEIRKLTFPDIPRSTLNTWVAQKKITVFKTGKRSYYSKKEVFAFLTSCKKL